MAEHTFEEKLATLEGIVNTLETGDVPLEKASDTFKVGVQLRLELEKTLKTAEKTVTEMVSDDGTTTPLLPQEGTT